MKAGDKFKLDAKWWRDNKPKTMIKSSGLGKALDDFAKAEAAFNGALGQAGGKNPSEKPYKAFKDVWSALEDVDKCRDAALKLAGKLHKETTAALSADQAIKSREKLLRELMAKAIAADVKSLIELHNETEKRIEELAKRQETLQTKFFPKAEKGDSAALKTFSQGVARLNSEIGVGTDPDQVRLRGAELHGYIAKLPGDFSGHVKSCTGIIQSALKMQKSLKPLMQWCKEYAKYDADN